MDRPEGKSNPFLGGATRTALWFTTMQPVICSHDGVALLLPYCDKYEPSNPNMVFVLHFWYWRVFQGTQRSFGEYLWITKLISIMTLGSERFGSAVLDDEEAVVLLEFNTRFRMKVDYWMSDEEIRSWSQGALDFAKSDSKSPVTAVVVGLDVWTVQKEGEAIEAAIDRAIKPESLIPIFLWGTSVPEGTMSIRMTAREVLFYGDYVLLLIYLPRIRVEDEAGLGLVCPVCSQSSVLGAQLFLIPTCNHACHPRCLFDWLNKGNYLCPSCSDPIPTDEQIYDDLEQLASSTPTLPRHTHTH